MIDEQAVLWSAYIAQQALPWFRSMPRRDNEIQHLGVDLQSLEILNTIF